jgi:hypothetical protein
MRTLTGCLSVLGLLYVLAAAVLLAAITIDALYHLGHWLTGW